MNDDSGFADTVQLVHGAGEFLLLKAYMDESGIHQGSPVCVVAGFIADSGACCNLEIGWKCLLQRQHVTYFHAKEFSQSSGVFRGWSESRKQSFASDAFITINRNLDRVPAATIAAAIWTEPFQALSVEHRKWLTGGRMSLSKKWKTSGAPNKPYFLPFQQCVVDATQIIDSERLVHFVFDQQNEFEASAKRLFALMRGQHRDISERLGDIVYTSKKRAILLQVADFVAYEIFQMLIGNRPKADRSMSMQHPIFQPSTLLTTIDSMALARMLKEQPVIPDRHFVWPRRSLAKIGGVGWRNQNSSILMT